MLFRLTFIFFFGLIGSTGKSQGTDNMPTPAQLGFSGLIYTPSAYMSPWKTVDVGFTHFSKTTSFTYQAGVKSERAFITNVVFLPRIEFSVKLTRPYSNLIPGIPAGSDRPRYWGIGDRSYGLRVQLLKEQKHLPAILVGIQDPFANAAFFNTNYLVASKSFVFNEITIATNLGFGHSVEETIGDYLQGVFGGAQVTWKKVSGLIEYDTHHFNLGLSYHFKELIFFNVALINAQHFSGNISFRFSLN